MIYSEAAYFEGNHCQHVAAWEEEKRLARKRKEGEQAARRGMRERRHNGRALYAIQGGRA